MITYDFNLPILELHNGDLRVSSWALTVKEFRGIYEADTRSDKRVAAATLLYIALREDFALIGVKLAEEDRHTYAMENCGILRLKKEWKANNHIYTAMEKYRELQMIHSVDAQLLFSTERAIQNLSKNLTRIAMRADQIFDKKKLDKDDVIELDELIDALLNKTSKLSERLDNVNDQREAIAKRRRYEKHEKITANAKKSFLEDAEDSILNKKIK